MHVFVSPERFDSVEGSPDFCCTEADELLALWSCPCSDETCPKEAFTGLETHRASTVGVVQERADVDEPILLDMFRQDLINRGWYDGETDRQEVEEWLSDMVADVSRAAAMFEIGTWVRYDGEFFWMLEDEAA